MPSSYPRCQCRCERDHVLSGWRVNCREGPIASDCHFSRTLSTRNTRDRLIATPAYQLALSIPDIPAVFISRTQLNEIQPSSRKIFTTKSVLSLSNLYNSYHRSTWKQSIVISPWIKPISQMRIFVSSSLIKFKYIRPTHPTRSTIPISLPTQQSLETLVRKSSGRFVNAATVVKFVKSSRYHPITRLNIILSISSSGIWNHLQSDIQLTLNVLILCIVEPQAVSLPMPPTSRVIIGELY